MASFFDAVKERIGGAYCNVSDFSVWYAANASELLTGTVAEAPAEVQEQLFRHWNQLACGVSPDTPLPAVFDKPFTGGQCEKPYNVSYRFYATDSGGQIISGSDSGLITTAPLVGAISYGSTTEGGVEKTWLYWNNGASRQFLFQEDGIFYQGEYYTAEIVEFSVDTTDGSPDDCGDISTALPADNNPLVDTTDINYEDENGDPQTAQGVEFTFGLPFLEPDGTISVPYEVCYNGFCTKGKQNFGEGVSVISEPPFKLEELTEDIGELLDEKDRTDEVLDALSAAEANQEKHLGISSLTLAVSTFNAQQLSFNSGDYIPSIATAVSTAFDVVDEGSKYSDLLINNSGRDDKEWLDSSSIISSSTNLLTGLKEQHYLNGLLIDISNAKLSLLMNSLKGQSLVGRNSYELQPLAYGIDRGYGDLSGYVEELVTSAEAPAGVGDTTVGDEENLFVATIPSVATDIATGIQAINQDLEAVTSQGITELENDLSEQDIDNEAPESLESADPSAQQVAQT
ncbi:hypothetical protein Lepto7376_4528 [[Leptolyngbya] sp. PCC 7376]|uniref:hypothetical protein n=1 Tax=[Leptolyngbya] sp. PCC 7376 TaxID=111781 RepID=UPI00029EFAAC|nr:hypothetical protein [[Leptolyngbya] sp. PCC 7376]AFY40626.1 hypothetical protein Lepto7376_4528 [[Leptolyngbya] sp. PCC 7376]